MNKQFNGFSLESRTFVTGDIPSEAFGILGGREDFSTRALQATWYGCIDAPEFVPNGKLAVVEDEGCIVPGSSRREG